MAYKLSYTGDELSNLLGKDYVILDDISNMATQDNINNLQEQINYKVDLFPMGAGQEIPSNIDLNTIEYCKIGHFVCPVTAAAKTLSNCPTTSAFAMYNFYPLRTDKLNVSAYTYCVRIILDYVGYIYTQYVSTNPDTPGDYYFSKWNVCAYA